MTRVPRFPLMNFHGKLPARCGNMWCLVTYGKMWQHVRTETKLLQHVEGFVVLLCWASSEALGCILGARGKFGKNR